MQKRLATRAFASAEDVIRRALESLEAEESWSDEERRALDDKIGRALEQVAAGQVYGPEEARRKLAALKETPLDEGFRQISLDPFQLAQDAIFDIDGDRRYMALPPGEGGIGNG